MSRLYLKAIDDSSIAKVNGGDQSSLHGGQEIGDQRGELLGPTVR